MDFLGKEIDEDFLCESGVAECGDCLFDGFDGRLAVTGEAYIAFPPNSIYKTGFFFGEKSCVETLVEVDLDIQALHLVGLLFDELHRTCQEIVIHQKHRVGIRPYDFLDVGIQR